MPVVHPSAVVHPKAELADDVVVDAFTLIDADVSIGSGTRISSSVRIHSGTRIGERVEIFHGAAIGGFPQDLKFGGEPTEVFVGDATVIREYCTVNRATLATRRTRVGKSCLLMAYSHVAHDCTVGDNVILANSVNLAGHVEIEDFAILGGMVPVHQFVRIGRHCMIGGGFRVPKDVPPYILAGGAPLRYFGLNAIGLKRRGFSAETRASLKRAYGVLFQSNMNTRVATERMRAEYGHVPEVAVVLEFLSKSKRGLLPGRHMEPGDSDE